MDFLKNKFLYHGEKALKKGSFFLKKDFFELEKINENSKQKFINHKEKAVIMPASHTQS